ncbi:MAG: hypothetical protein U9Q21_00315 [Candidatus Auribacterota bacterium]|nr:hypothetical protein [Candidatus Auribacterota bacterium]
MKWKLLAIVLFLVISVIGIAFSDAKKEGTMISFSVKKMKDIYSLGQNMLIEVSFKNNSKYHVKLHKVSFGEEKLFFRLKLDDKYLVSQKMKTKHNIALLRRAKIGDSLPESIITLKPTEEYKTEINIAEMVKELKLEPGTYKAQLVYTMWFSILKEKPEYAKNAKGKTREWESNEIEITLK